MNSVGDVFIPDDDYVKRVKALAAEANGWKREYSKNGIMVHSRLTEMSQVKLFKVNYTFMDVPASVLFNTLMDSDYRKQWDKYMITGYELCRVGPTSDIGYYAIKSFPGLNNRDFVTQRYWESNAGQYLVFSHSVTHKTLPPQKQFVRAKAILVAFMFQVRGSNSCEMTYLCQCDPRGKLPAWVINRVTQFVVPSVIKNLRKASLKYEAWKSSNQPAFRPWLYPDQSTLKEINWEDVQMAPSGPEVNGDDEMIDESGVSEVNDAEIDADDAADVA